MRRRPEPEPGDKTSVARLIGRDGRMRAQISNLSHALELIHPDGHTVVRVDWDGNVTAYDVITERTRKKRPTLRKEHHR